MKKSVLVVMLVCGVLAGLAQGQEAISVIATNVVVGPRTGNLTAGTLYTTNFPWSVSGGNAVVVMFAAEGASSMTATFAGQAMNVTNVFDNDRFVSSIAYLVKPAASSGDIELTITTAGGSRLSHAYSVLTLAGVGEVAGSDTRTSNGDLSYTTSRDGGYVVGVAVNNFFNGPAPTVSVNPDLILLAEAVDGNCSILQAHGTVDAAGMYSDTYDALAAAASVAFDWMGPPAGTVVVIK